MRARSAISISLPRALVIASVLFGSLKAEADPVEGPPRSEGFPKWPGLAVGGVGLAGVAMGIGFAIEAMTAADEARELRDALPAPDACLGSFPHDDCNNIQNKLESHDVMGTASIVSFAVGGALLATGVALFAVSLGSAEPDDDKPAITASAPWFTSSGGGIVVGGRF